MSEARELIIAIDGPAASGKSTTARLVARELGYTYIDSGAMYRAVTLKALRQNIPVDDRNAVAELAAKTDLQFGTDNLNTVIFMDGEDVSEAIRTPEIDRNISPVAANAKVREILVEKQQKLGRNGGVVMDGRDIGTVVFPNADLKIYMLASVEERALRRQKELLQKGVKVDLEKVRADIRYRDKQDTGRAHGPLKKAAGAVEIDTTGLTIPQQVQKIVRLARQRLEKQDI
ncbi:cytidylate kinase [candidate division KSB1 bacterium 4484_188]|nr:MAG: cytidylate kinase [candidate division KSB1 bacterium 4484_188]